MNALNSYKMDLSDDDLSFPLTQKAIPTSAHKREPTAEEKKLTNLLIERVLPPFSKSLKLQAIVVYQADQEKMKCLLVNQTYEKSNDTVSSEHESPNHSLSDSGIMDTSTTSVSPIKTETCSAFKNYDFSITRRKRKLSRPCKIPQNSSSVSNPVEPPSSTPAELPSTPPVASQHIQKSISEPINPLKNGATNGLFLPVSAVTLLPHVSVFSLPVTVLSTVPRPILPRISTDKPSVVRSVSNCTLQTTISPHLKRTAGNPSSKNLLAKESSNVSEDSSVLNRRYAKSFVCNQCRKSFTSLSLLCEHTFAVHKAFRCTICGAQFTQRSNLQRHSLRHVGFKPFVCKICDKSYYRKDHLVRHIELTHPGCDPRTNLTVKLSSAECLDYLDQINKHDRNSAEQVQILCQDSNNGDKNNVDASKSSGNNDVKKEDSDLKIETCIPESQPPRLLEICSPHQPCTRINS